MTNHGRELDSFNKFSLLHTESSLKKKIVSLQSGVFIGRKKMKLKTDKLLGQKKGKLVS